MWDAGTVLVLVVTIGVGELGLALLVGGMITYGQRRSTSRWETRLEGAHFE